MSWNAEGEIDKMGGKHNIATMFWIMSWCQLKVIEKWNIDSIRDDVELWVNWRITNVLKNFAFIISHNDFEHDIQSTEWRNCKDTLCVQRMIEEGFTNEPKKNV